MATNIFNYNGSLLATIQDGTVNTTSSSLSLPGRAYQNYGEAVNQDMLWIMQNFANPSPPLNPVVGQLWYDSGNQLIKFYSGSTWIAAGGVLLSDTTPAGTPIIGNFWYDTINKQLHVWNGSNWDLVGPLGSAINTDPENPAIPTFSALDAIIITDSTSSLHQIWRMTVGGILVGIISKDSTFIPAPTINGFSTISPGFNINSSISGAGYSGDPSLFRGIQSNVPSVDNTWNLGSPSLRFANIYAVNVAGVATSTQFNSLSASVSVISSNLATLTSNVAIISENIRSRLTGNTIFYVGYSGGNDSNTGLSPTASFATITGAWNALASRWDCQGYDVTFQLNNATFGSSYIYGTLLNAGTVSILGNISNPALVSIAGVNSYGILFQFTGEIFIGGLTLSASGSVGVDVGAALVASTGSIVNLSSPVIFTTSGSTHITAENSGIFETLGINYSIIGSAPVHLFADGGTIATSGSTITLVGTPNFSTGFAVSDTPGAYLIGYNTTFVGSATGPRYIATLLSAINTQGGGANFYPGNSAGSVSAGAQYV